MSKKKSLRISYDQIGDQAVNDMNTNIWLSGIMGVVVGDALGCPVQFMSREEVKRDPVNGMRGYGTFNLPEGSWTDDSSLTLALLASINERGGIDLHDIMHRFSRWLNYGEYTPFGRSFDIGMGTMDAICRYIKNNDTNSCGGASVSNNGNGSLMRIMPACIYAYEKRMKDDEAVSMIHEVSGLTHGHLRSKIACGLYYFCVCSILNDKGSLAERIQNGIYAGFRFYQRDISAIDELVWYSRLKDIKEFADLPENEIKSSGYVVDSLEAAIWSLITTDNFKDCELRAVNLGDDTDTVGAIAGGLAGLYYGYSGIPAEWIDVIRKREWIEELCAIRNTGA